MLCKPRTSVWWDSNPHGDKPREILSLLRICQLRHRRVYKKEGILLSQVLTLLLHEAYLATASKPFSVQSRIRTCGALHSTVFKTVTINHLGHLDVLSPLMHNLERPQSSVPNYISFSPYTNLRKVSSFGTELIISQASLAKPLSSAVHIRFHHGNILCPYRDNILSRSPQILLQRLRARNTS